MSYVNMMTGLIKSLASFCVCVIQSTVERLVKDKMPKKSGRWWFSWRRRDMDNNQVHFLLMVIHRVMMVCPRKKTCYVFAPAVPHPLFLTGLSRCGFVS